MTMQPALPAREAQPPLVDTSTAPEVLASGVAGIMLRNGLVTITLENVRADHSTRPLRAQRRVSGHVAMPVQAAQILMTALYEFLSANGVNPLTAAAKVQ